MLMWLAIAHLGCMAVFLELADAAPAIDGALPD
jgi:hypothetical protein